MTTSLLNTPGFIDYQGRKLDLSPVTSEILLRWISEKETELDNRFQASERAGWPGRAEQDYELAVVEITDLVTAFRAELARRSEIFEEVA
jgi:hypothetical protein